MDPVSLLSVFLKVAIYFPNKQLNFKDKKNINISRTELIEIYRNDMNQKFKFDNGISQKLN